MSNRKKNENASVTNTSEDIYASVFGDLVQAVIEDTKEREASEEEAFGSYVQRVRSKMHVDANLFQKRFCKGYENLLDQLRHGQGVHGHSNPDDRR